MSIFSSSSGYDKEGDVDISGFDTFESQIFGSIDSKSQLYVYLEELWFDHNTRINLDTLQYWESYCSRFPKLSLMACNIMSISINTVASKSTFNIRRQILD